jgi:hypothetical protein
VRRLMLCKLPNFFAAETFYKRIFIMRSDKGEGFWAYSNSNGYPDEGKR